MNENATDARKKTQRIYGRGMFAGLQLAGIENPREYMNQAKIDAAVSSLNGIARKVFEAVPCDEPAKPGVILQLLSAAGSRPSLDLVEGSLRAMCDKGIVKEPSKGLFIRVQAKPKTLTLNGVASAEPSVAEPLPSPNTPMEWLTGISGELRTLAKMASALAEKIDDAALDIEQGLQSARAETTKLTQLKELLRTL